MEALTDFFKLGVIGGLAFAAACSPTRGPLFPAPGTLTHKDSAAIFIALADTLWNAYGDAPPYVAGHLPRWLADTLRTTPFFTRPCDMRHRQCREPRPGLAFTFGPVNVNATADSVEVWVSEEFHPPPRRPGQPQLMGFGASISYSLRRIGMEWRVVRIAVGLIS